MLRSFLLRRLRRHGCRSVSQLDRRASRADAFSSWSYASPWVDDRATGIDQPDANPVQAHKRRHLYLVLDDWKKGFSIYKLDLDDDNGSHQGADMALPAPVHRQEKRHVTDRPWNFATLGSKIIAAGALDTKEDAVTLMYDTDTTGVSVIPCLPPALRGPWTLAVASGNGLNVFEANLDSLEWRDRHNIVGNGMHAPPGCTRISVQRSLDLGRHPVTASLPCPRH